MPNGPRVIVRPGETSRPVAAGRPLLSDHAMGQGPEDEHQILGFGLQALYDHAQLGRGDLIGTSWLPDDLVQLIPECLSLAEHFCIWDTVQLYRQSVTYMARIR